MTTRQTRKMLKSRSKFNREVIGRDMECRIKGSDCRGYLAPHHIVGRTSEIDDVKENGITLCSEHHRRITNGSLKVHASWLTEDQIEWIINRKWQNWEKIIWDRN